MKDLRKFSSIRRPEDERKLVGEAGRKDAAVLNLTIEKTVLNIIASTSRGWEHVSVTVRCAPQRCPTWEEMDFVRRELFRHDETVMQLHVPVAENVDIHPYCLHLWRPQKGTIPRPPNWMVM